MNTNVTKSYWDFKLGEVKFFTPSLIPSELLTDIFTINISNNQIEELKKLPSEYGMLLNRYKQYTNLSDEQIDLLTKGLEQRINIFENVMKKKGLIK